MNKTEAQEAIDGFFQRDNFSSDELRKIRSLAMKYKIRLGVYRKLYCKHCLSMLKGETRISKEFKTIKCSVCGKVNRVKLH
jgi:RNase P subunit RPR2